MVQESLTQRVDAHKETQAFAGLLINPYFINEGEAAAVKI
jgi:hypothetical protein